MNPPSQRALTEPWPGYRKQHTEGSPAASAPSPADLEAQRQKKDTDEVENSETALKAAAACYHRGRTSHSAAGVLFRQLSPKQRH